MPDRLCCDRTIVHNLAEMRYIEAMNGLSTENVPFSPALPAHAPQGPVRFFEVWLSTADPIAVYKATDGLRRLRRVCLTPTGLSTFV